MYRRGAHLFVAVCLLLCLSSVRGELVSHLAKYNLFTIYSFSSWSTSVAEKCVGTLPNFQHDIEGQLCIIDEDTMVIRGFGYDGSAPG